MNTNIKKNGIGSHEATTAQTHVWLTPKYIINSLGQFTLDPCACSQPRPWDTAQNNYTIEYDGLNKKWFGRVWCNPPYGKFSHRWLSKLAEHGEGIALIFARTETKMFFDCVWNKATAVLFLQGRLKFCRPDGTTPKANAGALSVLVAYGDRDAYILESCDLKGKYIYLK